MSRIKSFKVLTGNKLGETGKALKFEIKKIGELELNSPRIEWFPFSQLDKMYKDPNTVDKDYIIASDWIIKEKGLDKLERKVNCSTEAKIESHNENIDDDDDYFPF